jgi:hypothetical protein
MIVGLRSLPPQGHLIAAFWDMDGIRHAVPVLQSRNTCV